MVRKNRPSSGQLAAYWDQLPPSRQQVIVRQIQLAFAEMKASVEPDGDNHPPILTGGHHHWHTHAPSENVEGLDDQGGHSHTHQHPADSATTQHAPHPDNSHRHSHDDMPPKPGTPGPYERPPEARGRHIRYSGGQVQVLNSARRTPPVNPRQQGQINAAWSALSQTARQIERRHR